jgi:hypothetical protein
MKREDDSSRFFRCGVKTARLSRRNAEHYDPTGCRRVGELGEGIEWLKEHAVPHENAVGR